MAWNFFKKKAKPLNYIDEKQHSPEEELRRMQYEIKKTRVEHQAIMQQMELEKAKIQLEDLKDELYGDDDGGDGNTPEALFMNLISNYMAKGQAAPQQAAPAAPQPITQSFTDEQLREFKSKMPQNFIESAKVTDENILSAHIISFLPSIDKESLERAIKILKE